MSIRYLALGLVLTVLFITEPMTAQTAKVQVIHNAADPAAESVDIYVNGVRAIDDFAFRTATPFIDLPAGFPLSIAIAPGNSTTVADAVATVPVTLASGQTYVVMAAGLLDAATFADNPDGLPTGFALHIADSVRVAASGAGTDLLVFHGVTDAPAVDVIARGVAPVVDDLPYAQFTSYVTVPAASYILDITPGNDPSTVVASYVADLTALEGGAAVVFASGFLNPSNNKDGAGFGLYAALPDGSVVTLPTLTSGTARVQIIHNAADPAVSTVDIYVNDSLLLDDFAFRTATPFVDVPAGLPLAIGVAPASSTSSADALRTVTVTLQGGETYVVVANGVIDPSGFADNPESRSTAFELFVRDAARERAAGTGVDLTALHGATDAPSVDVIARGVATVIDDAPYGGFSEYFTVPAASYILDVTPGGDNSTIVASYLVDLSALEGGAAVVFASGFLDPSANQSGAAFGLFAALPDGTVFAFPAAPEAQARVQIIHNAADPAAATVDVYVNDMRALDNFAFRSATPFIDLPADVELTVGIAPPGSMSAADAIATFRVTFEDGKRYVVVANGVLNPAGFAANPDGRPTAFTLLVTEEARETAPGAGVYLVALHGATDAPTVDVVARGVATLVDDAPYAAFSDGFSVPAARYTLDVTPGNDNSTIVASYVADLSGLDGGAAVVFASGFLTPSANADGPAFGLYAALPNGTVLPLSPATSVSRMHAPGRVSINAWPLPASSSADVAITSETPRVMQLTIVDVLGRQVFSAPVSVNSGSTTVRLATADWTPGMYRMLLAAPGVALNRPLVIAR